MEHFTLRAEFDSLRHAAERRIETAEREHRDLSDDEKAENDKSFIRMKTIESSEAAASQYIGQQAASGMLDGGGGFQLPRDFPGRQEHEANQCASGLFAPGQFSRAGAAGEREQFTRTMSHWARTGAVDRQTFATVTSTSGGGILLPKIVAEPLITGDTNAFRLGLSLVGSGPIQTPGAQDLTIPVLDQAAGSIVSENAAVESENEPALNSIRLLPKMFQSGSAWFSNLALEALDYRLEDHIVPELLHSKETALESAIVSAMIADTATAVTLTPSTSTISYVTMLSLLRAVPRRFSRQMFLVLNSEVFATLEKLLDSTGRPLLVQDPQNGNLLRFNGVPLVRSDLFENLGAINKTLGVVISALGFRLRDCGGPAVARYAQFPARPAQTGFNLFSAHAYGWTTAAVARLRTPAV